MVEIICESGDEPAAALFVLMGMLQNSTEPEALVNALKHLTFTHCGERNVYGLVDAQLPVIEGELLAAVFHQTPNTEKPCTQACAPRASPWVVSVTTAAASFNECFKRLEQEV